MPLPSLIVVTGPPGAGKTTLAHPLAQAVRCPLVSRDEIKEGLVNTVGGTDDGSGDLLGRTYEAFFDTLHLLLEREVTVMAEAAFQHRAWAPRLEPLMAISRLRIVVCALEPEVALQRRAVRAHDDPDRARFHPDRTPPSASDVYDPPHLAVPTLSVRTLDGYDPDFGRIVAFARGA